jgi:zona occludens toxin (predicted ATPase)
MIVLFEGFPGSGKSYDAVRKILSNLKKGRRVVTNIDGIDQEHQQAAIQHYLDLDDFEISDRLIFLKSYQVLCFWDYVQPGDIIVIDEAQNFFNARDWQKESNRNFGKWASEHRHNGNDLFLITPNQGRIDSSVRELVEWYYRYKKLNMFGSLVQKGYMRFAFYGQDAEPIGKKMCRYDTSVFRCYKSFFESDLKEHSTMKHANILKNPLILSVPFVLVIVVYFLAKSSFFSGDIFGAKEFQKAHAQVKPEIESEIINSPVVEQSENQIIGYVNGKPLYKKGGSLAFDM